MIAELVALNAAIMRAHRAAVDARDPELAAVLREMGWTTVRALARLAREERVS